MKSLYFKRLDSLRFFAFFLVFWQHGFVALFDSFKVNALISEIILAFTITGGIGVHIFFVISGFLITFLLIQEHETNGQISIKKFYIRRVLRIWPVYYLVMIAGIFILPNISHAFHFCGSLFKSLSFLNNFDNPSCTSPNTAVAWSVAIEEQFYLFWPILFLLFFKRKLLAYVCVAMYIISTFYVLNNLYTSYSETLANINYLMVGCWGAIMYSTHRNYITSNRFFNSTTLYTIISTGIAITVLLRFYKPVLILASVLMPFIYLFVIVWFVDKGEKNKGSVFSALGKYTYGMYFYHATIILLTRVAFDKLGLNYRGSAFMIAILGVTVLLLTIGFSILSYEYFEKFFLKYKTKFESVKTRI